MANISGTNIPDIPSGDWASHLSADITDFLSSFYGPDVRAGFTDIAYIIANLVLKQAISVTDNFDNPPDSAAAQAKALGNLLYGGTDHTGRTPGINVHYAPTIPEDGSFDVINMPRNSHIYTNGAKLKNIPDALLTDDVVYVARISKTVLGNVSMFFATGARSKRSYFCHSYIENADTISWTEVSTIWRGRNYAGAAHIDDLVSSGVYFSDIDSGGNKTLPGFPFRVGFVIVLQFSSVTTQIAVSLYGETIKRGGRLVNNEYVWGEWVSDDAEDEEYDFLYTDFDIDTGVKWWNLSGGHYTNETGPVTKPIPVRPGQKLYGMWFGGFIPQSCGGAFLNEGKSWVAPVDFPYNGAGGTNVREFAYELPDVTPGSRSEYQAGGLIYSKFWEITVPSNAFYISLNLKNIPDGSHYIFPRSLSTLPMIAGTQMGNKIWRKDDPRRAIKEGKRLYVIGPSTVAIDRSYRPIYDNDNSYYEVELSQPTDDRSPKNNGWYERSGTSPNYTYTLSTDTTVVEGKTYYSLPKGVICGFQEYLIPYYKEVVSLAFNGKAYYYGDETNPGVYSWLHNNEYYNYNAHKLNDADEVFIVDNGNTPGNNSSFVLGDVTDTGYDTYCGALNNMIDLIYTRNADHPVRIYLHARFNQWNKNDPAVAHKYEIQKARNEKTREIAALKGCAIIDEESAGINYHNYKYYSYDSQRDIYRGYGGHPNNAGNNIRGNIVLNGLLSDGSVCDTSVAEKIKTETAKSQKMEGILPSGDVQALNGNVFYALSGSNSYTNLPSWAGDTNAKRAGYIQQVELNSSSKILIYYSKLYGIGTCVCTGGTWGEWLQIPAAYVPFPTAAEAGNVLAINDNGEYVNVAFQTLLGYFLPQPTQADAGKILKVDSNGNYVLATP